MANRGPNTNSSLLTASSSVFLLWTKALRNGSSVASGSQFFILTKVGAQFRPLQTSCLRLETWLQPEAYPKLDLKHVVFGRVVEGMGTVRRPLPWNAAEKIHFVDR